MKNSAFEDEPARKWPKMLPPWLLHPELSSHEILLNSSNIRPFFCPLWLTGRACFFHFLHDLDHCESFNGFFLNREEFVDFYTPRKSHILLKHESVHFLARRLMSLYWQEKNMSRRILDRIKRALITILECQSDLTTFCVRDVGQVT